MRKLALTSGILCIALAVVIFVFAEGLRRWYSGIFFAVIGLVAIFGALRGKPAADR